MVGISSPFVWAQYFAARLMNNERRKVGDFDKERRRKEFSGLGLRGIRLARVRLAKTNSETKYSRYHTPGTDSLAQAAPGGNEVPGAMLASGRRQAA
jgi:hypothetical protein